MIKRGLNLKSKAQFVYGLLVHIILLGLFVSITWFLLSFLEGLNYWLYIGVSALILKSTFCLKQQWQVARKTINILEAKEAVPASMKGLFTSMGKKDEASKSAIISSSIRSIAENASDFVTGPLFYYLILGVPGAIAYRVTNTTDNMIGYHGQYEYLGKFSARFDDVASYIPARITALLIVIGAILTKYNAKMAWKKMLVDHNKPPGLNGGWPMATMAGALNVKLHKTNCYEIGSPIDKLTSDKIGGAITIYRASMAIWMVVCFTILTLIKIEG